MGKVLAPHWRTVKKQLKVLLVSLGYIKCKRTPVSETWVHPQWGKVRIGLRQYGGSLFLHLPGQDTLEWVHRSSLSDGVKWFSTLQISETLKKGRVE